jgi:hypothetical protein
MRKSCQCDFKFKEDRLILPGPWQEEDCLRTEELCAVLVLPRWYVTSRAWSKIYWTVFYAVVYYK